MAQPTFTDNTYAGKVLQMITTRSFTGNEVVQGGHVYVKDGIRDKLILPIQKVSDIIQDRAETPTTAGTINYKQRVLTPQDYMMYLEFNPRNFEGHWFEDMLTNGLLFRQLNPELQMSIVNEIMMYHDEYLGQALWTGNKTAGVAPNNKFDGFITVANADAATLKVASPVALTAANIISKLEATFKRIPVAVRTNPNLKIFLSIASFDLYREALQTLANKSISYESAAPRLFNAIQLVPLAGFPNDTLLAAVASASTASNLWVGVDGISDWSTLQVDRLQANSELWFFKALMKVAVQYRLPEEVVLYKV